MTRLRSGIAVGALVLAGCGGGEIRDLERFVRDSGSELRGRVDPLPVAAAADPVVYDAAELPDPFTLRRVVPAAASTGIAGPTRRPSPNDPLASYPLESLTMVGTVSQGGQRWALIRTPDNTIYRVSRGSFMGQQFGEVAVVTETSVTLHEYLQDGVTGQWSERMSSLQLQDDEHA